MIRTLSDGVEDGQAESTGDCAGVADHALYGTSQRRSGIRPRDRECVGRTFHGGAQLPAATPQTRDQELAETDVSTL